MTRLATRIASDPAADRAVQGIRDLANDLARRMDDAEDSPATRILIFTSDRYSTEPFKIPPGHDDLTVLVRSPSGDAFLAQLPRADQSLGMRVTFVDSGMGDDATISVCSGDTIRLGQNTSATIDLVVGTNISWSLVSDGTDEWVVT